MHACTYTSASKFNNREPTASNNNLGGIVSDAQSELFEKTSTSREDNMCTDYVIDEYIMLETKMHDLVGKFL